MERQKKKKKSSSWIQSLPAVTAVLVLSIDISPRAVHVTLLPAVQKPVPAVAVMKNSV